MARWKVWLKCIGQAVIAKGLRALLQQVPFGGLVLDVAADAIERINKEQPAEPDRRASLQELVQAPARDVQQEAAAVAGQAAAGQPPEVQQRLAGYLAQVPAVASKSLSRREDPTGKSVPAGLRLSQPKDLLPLLPTRVPRFKEGDRPLGIGDWVLDTGNRGEELLRLHQQGECSCRDTVAVPLATRLRADVGEVGLLQITSPGVTINTSPGDVSPF